MPTRRYGGEVLGTTLADDGWFAWHLAVRMAIRADPSKEGIGLSLLGHDRVLQGGHDLLAITDRKAKASIAQAFLAFVDPDFSATNVAELVLPSIEIVHSIAIVVSLNEGR